MVLLLDGHLELDPDGYELRRDGAVVPLEPQAFDVLLHLVEHRDRVVSKEELMDAVWHDRFVSETAVTSRIKQVRRALADDGQSQRVIRTVHRRGYRFVADVRPAVQPSAPPVGPPDGRSTGPGTGHPAAPEAVHAAGAAVPEPSGAAVEPPALRGPVRYTVSDGLHIAYQVSGSGDRDVVYIPGFISHLDIDWDDPRHATFLDGLGSMGRLVRFDKRGTGMSDRPSGVPDLETRMHDVLAVMDAVGSERAVVCGHSEGGPMAVMLAATHPTRVSALVLIASYAKRTRGDDNPWAPTEEQRSRYTEHLVATWDWESDLHYRCPSGDAAMQAWWSRRMRAAATPGTVRALMDMNALVDVRPLLGSVRVPTLVLHRVGDRLFPTDEARYLADRIPDATLRLLDGADHLVCGDPEQLVTEIGGFVEALTDHGSEHALAVVAAVAGADSPRVVEALASAGGRVRRSTAGAPLVLFDGPARAARAARSVLVGAPDATVGLSIDDMPVGADTVSGAGVARAVRLADNGPSGSVVVCDAVATLLAGTDVALEARMAGEGSLVRV
jgi:DNA-binding winged helix-turn-helix (wHTH) protein/pimeloyl-ACP methyl ester carboxylesterase